MTDQNNINVLYINIYHIGAYIENKYWEKHFAYLLTSSHKKLERAGEGPRFKRVGWGPVKVRCILSCA